MTYLVPKHFQIPFPKPECPNKFDDDFVYFIFQSASEASDKSIVELKT